MASLSSHHHRTLVAVAETALRAGRFIPAAGEQTAHKVEQFAATLPGPLQTGLAGLLRGIDAQAWLRERKAFARVSPEKRLALLDGWRRADPIRRLMLRALVSPLKMAHFDDPELYRRLGCVYTTTSKPEPKPPYMRDRVHAALDGDLAIEC